MHVGPDMLGLLSLLQLLHLLGLVLCHSWGRKGQEAGQHRVLWGPMAMRSQPGWDPLQPKFVAMLLRNT